MDKHPLASKTVWGSILLVLSGVYQYFTGDSAGAASIFAVGAGIAGYGFRDAMD